MGDPTFLSLIRNSTEERWGFFKFFLQTFTVFMILDDWLSNTSLCPRCCIQLHTYTFDCHMSDVLLAAVSPSLLDSIWPGQCWSWWGMWPDDASPIKNQILATITSVHISMHNGHSQPDSAVDLYTNADLRNIQLQQSAPHKY